MREVFLLGVYPFKRLHIQPCCSNLSRFLNMFYSLAQERQNYDTPALPCPALPCPALPCPKSHFHLKPRFIQQRGYLLQSISAVLSITLLFAASAQAQSNWWEQAKRNRGSAPAAVEPAAPSSPQPPASSPSAAQEQEIDTASTPVQSNTPADVKQIPILSYLEIGTSEIEFDDKFSSRGRYIGVCLEWLCGSYQRPATNFAITEVGINSAYRRHPGLQLTGALAWQRWEIGEVVDRRLMKLMIGLQAQFSQYFDMWINTGYMWTRKYTEYYNYKGEVVASDFFNTKVWKIGMQIFLTPEIGLIFEADFLDDMNFDFYRTGIRFNF